MGTSLDGIDLGFKALLSTKPWINDPAVVPIPYRQELYDAYSSRASGSGGKPLKVGILWDDGNVEPHPPVRRGLKLLVDAVKNAGHTVWDVSRLRCAVTDHRTRSSTGTRHPTKKDAKLTYVLALLP